MKKSRTAVIVGAQWGDEGKGKIVDVLSEQFSVVARYAGGHNAGHTVIINGNRFVLQLVPCGIFRKGCRGVIGNGVVLDPIAFLKEVEELRKTGVTVDGNNLFISNRAQVILPYHRMMELASENAPGRVKIGTTSRGIGPTYEDKMGRRGLRVIDLLDLELLKKHIENACREKNMIAHALFNSEPIDADKMYAEYADAAHKIAPFVADTALLLNRAIADGEAVMFEGAQATMLDIDHGTYPFVTSSSTTAGGRSHWHRRATHCDSQCHWRDQGLLHPRRRRAVSYGNQWRHCRPAPRARQRIWCRDRAPTPLRLDGPPFAALLQHDQRMLLAGGHQA